MPYESNSAAPDVSSRGSTLRIIPAMQPPARAARQLNAWHCGSALGSASQVRPARMQSCGPRRAATIGVIQMSPKVAGAPTPRNANAIPVLTLVARRGRRFA
jgi:hypothetical protein